MKEDDAKHKWCPESRIRHPGTTGYGPPAVNRVGDNTNCLGSGCMLWVEGANDKSGKKQGDCGLKNKK